MHDRIPAEMRAVVYHGANDLGLERLPVPRIRGDELLVQVAACGVCPTDIKKIIYGTVPPPRIFGHETAGTVVRVGSRVRCFRVGDRVALHHHVPCRGLLADPKVLKIFHFARFDIAAFQHWLKVETSPVYCTKVASRLTRTFTDRHGLKDLARDLIGVDLSKQQQSSDWGADTLTEAQVDYAASDVLYLHALKAKLDPMLAREGRAALAEACFRFLPTRAALDLAGWPEIDILAHS